MERETSLDPVRAASGRAASGRVRIARAVAAVWTLVLVVALVAPVVALPVAIPGWIPWPRGTEQPSFLDKLIHAVLFMVETRLLTIPGVIGRHAGFRRRAIVVALALASVTELLQAPIVTRTADFADFAANLVGIAIGAYLGRSGQTR